MNYFELGQAAVDFVASINPEYKHRIVLLADYELLNQNMTGLDVIAMTQVARAVLVTSHYANKQIQAKILQLHSKILHTQLASEVGFQFGKVIAETSNPENELNEVDIIFVDDEQIILDSFRFFASDKRVDTFNDPQKFLNTVQQYRRDTKIMLDQNFANSEKKGHQIAEELHAMGFTRLFLLSGENFASTSLPAYLKCIKKTDLTTLAATINECT